MTNLALMLPIELRVRLYIEYNRKRSQHLSICDMEANSERAILISEALLTYSNGHMITAEHNDTIADLNWYKRIMSESLLNKRNEAYMFYAKMYEDYVLKYLMHKIMTIFHRQAERDKYPMLHNIGNNIDVASGLEQSVYNFMFNYIN